MSADLIHHHAVGDLLTACGLDPWNEPEEENPDNWVHSTDRAGSVTCEPCRTALAAKGEPVVRMEATTYTFCCLPEDNVNRRHYTITVEKRGPGSWAVLSRGFALGADGDFEYEPNPSIRTDEWLKAHRFDLPTALKLAEQHAPLMSVNGISVKEALRRAEEASHG